MYRYLIIIIVLFSFLNSFGQEIDYNPKQLSKDVKKYWQIEEINLIELEIKDSNNLIQGKYYSLVSSDNESRNFIYIGRVNSCRAGGCSVTTEPGDDFESEYFDYYILFNLFGKVDFVRVYNYQATHGYEVTSKGWLRQFSGYGGEISLIVGKNIDAISGATISVYGITQDIQDKSQIIRSHLE